jgi:hypothetical protein
MGFDGGGGGADILALVHLYGAQDQKEGVEDESMRVFVIQGRVHGRSGVPEMWRVEVDFQGRKQRSEPGIGYG